MIQSACAMTAWWYSMPVTDLPESTSRSSRPSNCSDRALVDRHHTRVGGNRPVREPALAGAGDSGDDHKYPERDVDIDAAQVVRRRAADLHRLLVFAEDRLLDPRDQPFIGHVDARDL